MNNPNTQKTFKEIQEDMCFNPLNTPMPKDGQSQLDFIREQLAIGRYK